MISDSQALIPSQLRKHRDEIAEQFGVRRLAIFGSASRAELTEDGDIDVLVEFEGKATFDRFMDLKFYLEDLLERPVDLVTVKALRPELRATIAAEAIDVA